MDIIKFEETNLVIAKDQPEYRPMPAHLSDDHVVTCCWKLSVRERLCLLVTGKVWHQIMTFGMSLQPQLLVVKKPKLK